MQKFMTFLLTVAIILVGWIMISNECSIWEIIEAESNLIVCGGKMIGGDVCSLGLDGFMSGLRFPTEDLTANAG